MGMEKSPLGKHHGLNSHRQESSAGEFPLQQIRCRTWHCCSRGRAHSCSLDSIPGPELPCAMGIPPPKENGQWGLKLVDPSVRKEMLASPQSYLVTYILINYEGKNSKFTLKKPGRRF